MTTAAYPPLAIAPLERADRDDAVDVLTEAFLQEPWLRWTFESHGDRFPGMLRALQTLSVDIRYGMGWPLFGAFLDDQMVGVVGTSIPGSGEWPKSLDDAYAEYCEMIGPEATERLEKVATLEHTNRPPGRNVEVGVIGVHPSARRRGIGRSLLSAVHDLSSQRADTTGVYLATTDQNNVRFYQGAGYQVLITEPVVPGVDFWGMFRPHDEE